MGKKKAKEMKLPDPPPPAPPASKRKQPDLYSQIFADSTDSELEESQSAAATQRVTHHNSPISKKGKSVGGGAPQSPVKLPIVKKKERQIAAIPEKAPSKISEKKSKKVIKPLSVSKPVTGKGKQRSEDSSDESEDAEDYEFDDDDDEDEEEEEEEMEGVNEEDDGDSNEEEEEEQSDDSDSESDGDSANQTALRRQLKDLSYEELESLKQKMGLKEYNEAMFPTKKGAAAPKNKKRRKFERTNKNRPREISSKVRVPKLREVVKVVAKNKRTTKDPRFDKSCGEFNEKIWNTEYNFIRDIQKKEAEDMKKKIKSVGEGPKQREMRRFIQRVTDKEKSIEVKEQAEKKRVQDKEENRKRVQEGKRPFYMKKSTKKLVELVEKYDELKASGSLEKYLKKKRKKNAVRDKKTLNG